MPGDRSCGHRASAPRLASGGEITADLLNRRKSGETFWNRLHIAPIRDAAGNIEFFLSTQADVTYERAADMLEERVRDRTRERDRVWTLSQDLFNVCGFDGILRAINSGLGDRAGLWRG